MAANLTRPGVYNVEYFSGSQVAIYIGDVLVDEVTSLSIAVHQERVPLYGYADELFRDVSKGPVLVQGQFTINFKESGYLWLILNEYRKKMLNLPDKMEDLDPFRNSGTANGQNIEQIVNREGSTFARNKTFEALAGEFAKDVSSKRVSRQRRQTAADLTGFASTKRAAGGKNLGRAENMFEDFEDQVWQKPQAELDNLNRRADDADLNPFDIYVSFGDFAGDNSANHTVQKISQVYIVGASKQIVIDGQPIQEAYSFIARNLV